MSFAGSDVFALTIFDSSTLDPSSFPCERVPCVSISQVPRILECSIMSAESWGGESESNEGGSHAVK